MKIVIGFVLVSIIIVGLSAIVNDQTGALQNIGVSGTDIDLTGG